MYESFVLLSEVLLSAYPILIKRANASVFFQTGLRMAIYTVLAATAAFVTGSPLAAAGLWSTESIATGFLNLIHVGTSYTAFEQLPAGNAMALFYLYPMFNILGAAAVLGESLPLSQLPWIALAFTGALLLAQPTAKNWTLVGVVCALLAAATETGIYLWFKTKSEPNVETFEGKDKGMDSQPSVGKDVDTQPSVGKDVDTQPSVGKDVDAQPSVGKDVDTQPSVGMDSQPWTKMIQLYGSSGVLWALVAVVLGSLGFLAKGTFRLSAGSLGAIVLFNALVGFSGYALRFFLIPRISTVVFSVLSFFGVVSAYGLGWLFQGEVPTLTQLAGAVAVVIANGALLSRENI